MIDCIHLAPQSCDRKHEWYSIMPTIVHDIAEPARCFGAEDAEQDGQGAGQVSGEAARYATKAWHSCLSCHSPLTVHHA